MKLEQSRPIFKKFSDVKFDENSPRGAELFLEDGHRERERDRERDTERQTDRET
jgi:hypothetical protein